MSPRSVALIGARGYVGQEMVRLLGEDSNFKIAFATSREATGTQTISGHEVTFEVLEPVAIAKRCCDAYVLGLPNGLSAPYVEAIGAHAPESVIVDLSTDHRHKEGWFYGLPEIQGQAGRKATRIANPGCYATAAILALWPLRELITNTPTVVGLSGYSGAGTTPSDKNNQDRLRENVLPYAFAGHAHQGEISTAIGHQVTFAPHVMPFFRGLMVTVTAQLSQDASAEALQQRFEAAYAASSVVDVQAEPPEPQAVAGTPNAVVGGFAFNAETKVMTAACALDNLLKGAASQAHDNLKQSFGI